MLGLTTELERGRFLVGRIALAQEHRGDKVKCEFGIATSKQMLVMSKHGSWWEQDSPRD